MRMLVWGVATVPFRRVWCDADLVCGLVRYDAKKMPLGKLSQSTIKAGYQVLTRIANVLKGESREDLSELSSEFYTVRGRVLCTVQFPPALCWMGRRPLDAVLTPCASPPPCCDYSLQIIPHDFGFKKMREFVIRDTQTLKKKIEMVEALSDIALATKLLKDGDVWDKHPIDSHYECVSPKSFALCHLSCGPSEGHTLTRVPACLSCAGSSTATWSRCLPRRASWTW